MGFVRKRLTTLKPSPENDQLYRPVDPEDPEIIKLAESIRRNELREPIVITRDNYIVSGHRRYCAAMLAGLVTVQCRVLQIRRTDDLEAFVALLRDYNLQRDKTRDEKLREELVTVNPESAYQSLIDFREEQSKFGVGKVLIRGKKKRSEISADKREMADHIIKVVMEDRRDYWPLTVRLVHYALLNYQFLRNSAKRFRLPYKNDLKCYQDCSDMLTRLRLQGDIPWDAVTDEQRPVVLWNTWADPRQFVRRELNGFLRHYWRDLLQSQPNHLEVVCEKNSSFRIVKDVTSRYCLPTMSGRGFSGIDPWHEMYVRFEKSGKQKLVILLVTDFDPEGEEIVQVAGRTLRDDFGVPARQLELIKVAVTPEHVEKYSLPPNNTAKGTSGLSPKFVATHGEHVYEIEAVPPEDLKQELRDVIDGVIDVDLFNKEIEAEVDDAAFLEGIRRTAIEHLKDLCA